jgi:hypothetical protein
MIPITIPVAMVVAPGPVFFLLFLVQAAEISVRVAMGLDCPLVVINNLIVIPNMVIRVVGVISAIPTVLGATESGDR